jgi:hypothetical protein
MGFYLKLLQDIQSLQRKQIIFNITWPTVQPSGNIQSETLVARANITPVDTTKLKPKTSGISSQESATATQKQGFRIRFLASSPMEKECLTKKS